MGTSALTRFANSFVHQNVGEEGDVVSLRVARDGRVTSATTSYIAPDRLDTFVDETLERSAVQPGRPALAGGHHRGPGRPGGRPLRPGHRRRRPDGARRAGGGVRRRRRRHEAAGYCQTAGAEVVFANSAGIVHEGRYSSAVLDGIHQTGTSAGSGHAASIRLGDIDAAAVGGLAAARATDSADPYDAKPGRYEVVLAPECVATIAVFLSYYGFSGKFFNEGMSGIEPGTDQFDASVTLVDDVTDDRAAGVGFDTEGTRRRPMALIDGGRAANLLHDRRTAGQAGVDSTGHAARGARCTGRFPRAVPRRR